MDICDPPNFFAGDLGDPWVAAIARSMPGNPISVDFPGDWPDDWPSAAVQARVVVLHRSLLNSHDVARLGVLRARRSSPPKVVLCVGPHIRSYELDRWNALADVVLHEATASELLPRHLERNAPPIFQGRKNLQIAVLSTSFETRRMLAEGCGWAGFAARPVRDWDEAADAQVVLWDVPVLEPGWSDELARETKRRLVVTMLGFADRTTVAQARAAGALACLDVPCDLADLGFVLQKLTNRAAIDLAHAVPPTPMSRRAGVVGGRMATRELK